MEHKIKTVRKLLRDECLLVCEPTSGHELQLVDELLLANEFPSDRVEELAPEVDIVLFRGTVVVEQGVHLQEERPGNEVVNLRVRDMDA